jgi:hypothetical protein
MNALYWRREKKLRILLFSWYPWTPIPYDCGTGKTEPLANTRVGVSQWEWSYGVKAAVTTRLLWADCVWLVMAGFFLRGLKYSVIVLCIDLSAARASALLRFTMLHVRRSQDSSPVGCFFSWSSIGFSGTSLSAASMSGMSL